MSTTVNNLKFIQTMGAAIMVIAGVTIKNSNEQMKDMGSETNDMIGIALFTVGWLYTAYVLSKGKKMNKQIALAGSSIAILVAVMMMKMKMKKGEEVPMFLPATFALAWIVLGFYLGGMVGLIIPALVIGSMMFALPYQRDNCIVDGPGMTMFAFAWVMVAVLNSIKKLTII